jgi:phosphoglucomutase/phosphomannomutase
MIDSGDAFTKRFRQAFGSLWEGRTEMTTTLDLAGREASLRTSFAELSPDPAIVEKAIELLRYWFETPLCAPQRSAVLSHLDGGKYALLLDSFYQFVPFGTGGRRGRVGYGPNRINDVTVALSVQGHCDYLHSQPDTHARQRIVVAYDVRIFNDLAGTYSFIAHEHNIVLGLTSRHLARLACEIYAANGFVAFLPSQSAKDSFLSTPELSFLIRHLEAAGGVNMSASHNHPDDNGFKFYTIDGAQDIPPNDEAVAAYMNRVSTVKRRDFAEAARDGLIRELESAEHDAYLKMNLSLRTRQTPPSRQPIVFTPLSGTGDSTVGDVLRAAGYDVRLFRPQAQFDGTFSTVPSRLPNPELPHAAQPAIEFAETVGASIIFSTDPDADRLGLLARAGNGEWRYLAGNEIAAILSYYLILDRDFGPGRRGLVIKTLVTTQMMESIAREGGCDLVPNLLVGFKYIANVLNSLDRFGRYEHVTGTSADLLIAAEESHGVLLTPHIRDKDAAGGALMLAELSDQLQSSGGDLPGYFDTLARAHGNCTNAASSIVMRGIQGTQALEAMMGSLRTRPPERIGDRPVNTVTDYLEEKAMGRPLLGETDRVSRNLLVFDLEGARITIRPSGTEPKVKVYVDLAGSAFGIAVDRDAVRRLANELSTDVADICMERVGIRLSTSAKLLPDFVEVDLKKRFDDEFRPELLQNAELLATRSAADRRAWVRDKLAALGAGSDPLEAAAEAVAHLCAVLAKEHPGLASALGEVGSAVQTP